MVFKPSNNDDFNQALKYYFRETDVLPSNVSSQLIGRHDDITKTMIGLWDTSDVTNMSFAFDCAQTSQAGRANFNEDISNWNTSKVTTFYAMFQQQHLFNQPIGGWNTSKVTNFNYMFYGAHSFNQPIGGWNTSSATSMAQMFQGAVKFNQDIGDWDVSNVTDFSQMFFVAKKFNQDISRWDVRNGVSFQFMFANAIVFGYDIRRWQVSRTANLISMFVSATALQTLYQSMGVGFAATPKPEFFNYGEPELSVLYGFDMSFQNITLAQTPLVLARRKLMRASPFSDQQNTKLYKTQNGSKDSMTRLARLTSRAAKATLSVNGKQAVSSSSDNSVVKFHIRKARG